MTLTFDLENHYGSSSLHGQHLWKVWWFSDGSCVLYIVHMIFRHYSIVILTFDLDLENQLGASSLHGKHVCKVWWSSDEYPFFYLVHRVPYTNTHTQTHYVTHVYTHTNKHTHSLMDSQQCWYILSTTSCERIRILTLFKTVIQVSAYIFELPPFLIKKIP